MSPILPSDAPTADALSPALPNRPMDSSTAGVGKPPSHGVGEGRHSHVMSERVSAVESLIDSGQVVTDDDLLQHARDLTFLMECAHDRWMALRHEEDLETAYGWMRKRDLALELLSAEWRAKRGAQIQQAIAQGTGCFFLDSADRARVAMNEEGRQ